MSKPAAVHWVVDEGRVFTDMPATPDNPCTACGACCAVFRVSFYCGELTGGSGGVVPAEMSSKVNATIACMKGTEQGHGRCIALVGELGQRGIGCSIYANRPSTCREFSAWDANGQPNAICARLRAGLGLAPLEPIAPLMHEE